MRSIEGVYLFFAVAHPVSELIGTTNLRIFLNKDYYPTNRDDFPVNRIAGAGGSLLVLAILLAPFLVSLLRGPAATVVEGFWCFALGLALADSIQHLTHFVARPRELAPRVHLATILGVSVPLLWIVVPKMDVLQTHHLWPLLLGALIIFGNWSANSWKAQREMDAASKQPASPSAL